MATETTVKQKTPRVAKSATKYIEAVGRRKTAIARVRAVDASKNTFKVNDRALEEYFGLEELRAIVFAPLSVENAPTYSVTVRVSGGGVHAQAEAIRHGLSRVIVKADQNLKSELKKLGFMRRDARKKERKHFGLKKARKASQWSKR